MTILYEAITDTFANLGNLLILSMFVRVFVRVQTELNTKKIFNNALKLQ